MQKQLFLLVCLLFAATAALAQSDGNTASGQTRQAELSTWKRYTVEGERFSVSLPTLPAMTTSKRLIWELRKTRRERSLGVYADGTVYRVYVYENIADKSLEDFLREQYGNGYYDDAPATTVTQGGVTGRQYGSANSPLGQTSQYFATEGRFYQFSATGKFAEGEAVKQFFSSIMFGKKVEGIQVHDGEGLPFSNPSCKEIATGKQVDTKVRLVMKPEPIYTDEARQKQTVGTVVLKVVFSCNGSVENIRTIRELPHGLTAQAIAASRKIKYIPAVKDGKFASMWMQLEYNFNLY